MNRPEARPDETGRPPHRQEVEPAQSSASGRPPATPAAPRGEICRPRRKILPLDDLLDRIVKPGIFDRTIGK